MGNRVNSQGLVLFWCWLRFFGQIFLKTLSGEESLRLVINSLVNFESSSAFNHSTSLPFGLYAYF